MIDPERIETFKEGLNGKLTIKGTDNQDVAKDRVTRLRCRVTKDGVSYTSPYYSIRLADEKVGDEELGACKFQHTLSHPVQRSVNES